MTLRRRGVAERFLPPVSLALATRADDYVARLMRTRYLGEPDSEIARGGYNRWLEFFAGACRRALSDVLDFETQVRNLQSAWWERTGNPRRDSAVCRLIEAMPSALVLTVATAAQLTGRSYQAANEAVARLVAVGVLAPVTVGRRNRAFEATELVDAFTLLERQLASPAGDTRVAAPVRRVPRR